jgi:pimeloyl-ACP methyl ester carboxylesterase
VPATMTARRARLSVAGMSRSLPLAVLILLLAAPVAEAGEIRGGARPAGADRRAAKPRVARAAAARLETASHGLLSPCDDPPGTMCGSIDVPLDRRHPGGGTIPIFFAVLPHRDAGPAKGTILASEGGPGYSTTASVDGFAFLFDPLLDTRDLLLIDLRGTGRSAAIDCPDLQHGIGDQDAAIHACAAQLGASASLFGSADRAEDIEAVRAALGIPRLDYYGLSGGGLTVQAYAARHGDRLRTAVLDAPYLTGRDDAFQSPVATALVRSAVLVCERSPSCHRADPDPAATLERLLARVRANPVRGTALDADAQPHDVVVDEARVIDLLGDTSGGYLDASEISAAARALAHGDAAPLLRMAAETDFPRFFDQGDPRFYSDGDFVATFCTDGVFPWDTSAPEATRRAQYDAAVARLRPATFAPFSTTGWLGSLQAPGEDCVAWPQPTPAPPAVPPGARVPEAPALALTGDLDVSVPSENVRAVARRFPHAQLVTVANTGHVTAFGSQCARDLIVRFIATAEPVDASCARQFNPTYGVGRFVRRAGHRRASIARAAWAAAYDGIQRSFRMGGTTGAGLRGGSFTVEDGAFTYDRVRFSRDVAVSGTATLDGPNVTADLTIDGPEDGTLHVAGRLFPHTAPLRATGRIGGRPIDLLVPTA